MLNLTALIVVNRTLGERMKTTSAGRKKNILQGQIIEKRSKCRVRGRGELITGAAAGVLADAAALGEAERVGEVDVEGPEDLRRRVERAEARPLVLHGVPERPAAGVRRRLRVRPVHVRRAHRQLRRAPRRLVRRLRRRAHREQAHSRHGHQHRCQHPRRHFSLRRTSPRSEQRDGKVVPFFFLRERGLLGIFLPFFLGSGVVL